jgi:thiol-disulfide isomerase/thioredoxin
LQRSILVFAVALIALTAGALFFSARQPNTESQPVASGTHGQRDAASPAGAEPVNVAFKLADMDGTERDFSEWAGKHRMLNFWATWCAPCRREIPLLKAFQDAHGDGIQVIGIAVDFPEPVLAYAEDAQFNYPILVGEQDAMAVAESSGVDFIGLPFTMIADRNGELIGTHMGEIHQEQLDQIADVLARLDRDEIDKLAASKVLNAL